MLRPFILSNGGPAKDILLCVMGFSSIAIMTGLFDLKSKASGTANTASTLNLFAVQLPSYWYKMTRESQHTCTSYLKNLSARQPSLLTPYDIYLVAGTNQLIDQDATKSACPSLVVVARTEISSQQPIRLDIPTNRILFSTVTELDHRTVQKLFPTGVTVESVDHRECCDFTADVRFGSALDALKLADKLRANELIRYAQTNIVHIQANANTFISK